MEKIFSIVCFLSRAPQALLKQPAEHHAHTSLLPIIATAFILQPSLELVSKPVLQLHRARAKLTVFFKMKRTFNNQESNRKQRHRKRSTYREKTPEKGSRDGEETSRERSQQQRSGGGEREPQPNLSSNQSVATRDCSLQLTADAEPKQCRKSLRGKIIITSSRGCAINSHRTLLEVAGSRIETPDRAHTKGAQRGERASGVRNDTKPSGHRQQIEHRRAHERRRQRSLLRPYGESRGGRGYNYTIC